MWIVDVNMIAVYKHIHSQSPLAQNCQVLGTVQHSSNELQKLNWMGPWKNWISSTTMKLRKSLVKPVTWQNISSCLALPPKIIMHDAFNVILWTFADICVVVHDDLGWKNWTTLYNCRFYAASLALRAIFICQKRPPIYASCMTISGGRTEHVVIGFGQLAAVD